MYVFSIDDIGMWMRAQYKLRVVMLGRHFEYQPLLTWHIKVSTDWLYANELIAGVWSSRGKHFTVRSSENCTINLPKLYHLLNLIHELPQFIFLVRNFPKPSESDRITFIFLAGIFPKPSESDPLTALLLCAF